MKKNNLFVRKLFACNIFFFNLPLCVISNVIESRLNTKFDNWNRAAN